MSQFYQFNKSIITLSLLLLATLAVVFPIAGQQSNPKAVRPRQVFPRNEQTPDEILKIDTDLVSVDVRANDSEGRPLRNLVQGDFKVYVDGIEQPLAFFQVERRSGEPRPLAMVFAVDISGSMTPDEWFATRVECVLGKVFRPSCALRSHVVWYERKDSAEVYYRSPEAGPSDRATREGAKRIINPYLRCRGRRDPHAGASCAPHARRTSGKTSGVGCHRRVSGGRYSFGASSY